MDHPDLCWAGTSASQVHKVWLNSHEGRIAVKWIINVPSLDKVRLGSKPLRRLGKPFPICRTTGAKETIGPSEGAILYDTTSVCSITSMLYVENDGLLVHVSGAHDSPGDTDKLGFETTEAVSARIVGADRFKIDLTIHLGRDSKA